MKKSLLFLLIVCSLCLLAGCSAGSPPPPATHFSVTAPATVTAGVAFQVTVTALNDLNNVATGYSGTVHFTSSDSHAVLPASSGLTNGTGTFSVTFKTAAGQTITVSDAASLTGTSSAIKVGSGPAASLTVGAPSATTAGMPFNMTVTAFDGSNNVATTYSGTVHFTSTDTQAVLPANSMLTNGTGTFSATLKTIASTAITATDSVTASITGNSSPISVFSNVATHFVVATPGNATTRTPISAEVKALDGANNISTGYAGTIHFSSSDSKAVLPANSTLSTGAGTFSATLETVGNQTISATDTLAASVTGTSSSIGVSAAPALTITSAAPPNGIVATKYGPANYNVYKCAWSPYLGWHLVCNPCTPSSGCSSLQLCKTYLQNGSGFCRLSELLFVGFPFTATGGIPPISWSASPLPPGLNLNSGNGELIGTPTSIGTYNVAVMVADSGTPQAMTKVIYPIIISNPPPPVINATPPPLAGGVNLPYSFTFSATGGLSPLGPWSETGALPSGLLLNSSSGLLSGTPTAIGSFPVTLMVQDAASQNSAPQGFTIQIFAHGFASTGSLITERLLHTATLLNNGKVLVAGGEKEQGIELATAELYDPTTGSFASTGSMSTVRERHTATLLPNGKVLVTGGYNGTTDFATAELFDPATGSFAPTGSMSTPREYPTATLLSNGKVLITGGANNGAPLATAELYDPVSGSFSPAGSMGSARVNHTATLLKDGRVLVTGGNSGTAALATAELFDPGTGSFSPTGAMGTARFYHTATLLNTGKVLVTGGGNNGTGAVASAELFDPASGSFAATGTMATARIVHTATLLNDGTVLVAGGGDATAELFDPSAGSFSETGSMSTEREYHSATLLNDGKVLIAGGRAGGGGAFATAELYQ